MANSSYRAHLYDLDTPLVPGTSRRVKDSVSGQEVYRIVFWQPGLYEVRPAEGDSVRVEIREDSYLFGPPGLPATALSRRISEAEWVPLKGLEVEPYFHTVFYEEVSPGYRMMVLSFPALRFC